MNRTDTSRIYALKDPNTGEIRFIGETRYNPDDKLRLLWQQSRYGGTPNVWMGRWLRGLDYRGLKPIIEVLEESPARGRSKYWKNVHKDTILCPSKGGSRRGSRDKASDDKGGVL